MRPRIVTFFSWKGGVGRSFALVNTGVQLARKGMRVLLVDWDLEAPGLERYFQEAQENSVLGLSLSVPPDTTGLLGLLNETTVAASASLSDEAWLRRCSKVSISTQNIGGESHNTDIRSLALDILGSGFESSGYSKNLQSFSWRSFFSDHNGGQWIEKLREQWQAHYDVILVDSRTGLTDSSGICTVQLPDMIVLVFTANSQSLIEGIRFLEGVNRSRNSFACTRGRATIFPLLSRWDGEKEIDLAEEWLLKIERLIRPLVDSWLPSDFQVRRLLEELRVPHVARFSFGEQLPVLTHSTTDPELPGIRFDLLARLIGGDLSQAGTIIDPTYSPVVNLLEATDDEIDKIVINRSLRDAAIASHTTRYGSESKDVIECNIRLAQGALRMKEPTIASDLAGQAVSLARNLIEASNGEEFSLVLLSKALLLKADIDKALTGVASSIDAYRENLSLQKGIANADKGNTDHKISLSIAYSKIGNALHELLLISGVSSIKDEILASEALVAFSAAVEILNALTEGNSASSIVIAMLAENLEQKGNIYSIKNDPCNALKSYEYARSAWNQVIKELPDNREYRVAASNVMERTGDALQAIGDTVMALQYYENAVHEIRLANANASQSEWLLELCGKLEKLADAFSLEREFKKALSAHSEALSIRRRLAHDYPFNNAQERALEATEKKHAQIILMMQELAIDDGAANAGRVPMEYRAQASGRCQRQFIQRQRDLQPGERPAIQQWIDEWVERVDDHSPFTAHGIRSFEVQIGWRLITNSGQDESVIRPVIGAGGWPLIPGSSLKGLFRRACQKHIPSQLTAWCGGTVLTAEGASSQPGCLRFHGAWPADGAWTANLLDIAHPQQDWQVGIGSRRSVGAFAVVSLHRPKLVIGISSSRELLKGEWEDIEATMRSALAMGIGGRTCVGYGRSGRLTDDLLFECALEGQGPAAKLLDGTAEFRPTMFRAAIRGMALRLFGGVTDARTARQAVGRLFGSLNQEDDRVGNVGLVATAYTEATAEMGSFGWSNYQQPIYATSGRLQWQRMRAYSGGEKEALLFDLLAGLHGLTMSLGGFGRGWRRPDHRIFLRNYDKTPLGCHWQWRDVATLPPWIHVQSPEAMARLLQRARSLARQWLKATGQPIGGPAPWREVIHPQRMRIWTRTAINPADAEAVAWFHSSPEGRDADPCHLKRTILAGKMNQVGLIWNRLLPLLEPGNTQPEAPPAPPANPLARPAPAAVARPMARPAAGRQQAQAPQGSVSIAVHPGPYLESLVLHPLPSAARPEDQQHYSRFVAELNRGAGGAEFKPLLWDD